MQKDVIYIDVEDDITAIISKVKASKEKLVALVPPKRIGVLQSAVNLRLLARTADNAKKHLVLITGNAALSGLAASAKIPVARNLQSKPELAPIPVLKVDDDDVIEGDQLPVGDHAKTTAIPVHGMVPPSKVDNIDIDGDAPIAPKPAADRAKAKKGIKVPDFGTFRKRMFLLAGLGILLIAFLIWAIWVAPHATVVISAQTSDVDINTPLIIGDAQQTDSSNATLASVTQTNKVPSEIEFTATGTKDVGEKATGTVRFSTSSFGGLGTIPAGLSLQTSGGLTFVTNSAVTLAYSGGLSASGTTTVTAVERGTKYNGASGSLVGAPSNVSAEFVGSAAGGTEKTVKIVTPEDVQKAQDELSKRDLEKNKTDLKTKFASGTIVIDSSFKNSMGDISISPNNGQDVPDGKAKLSTEMTYTQLGIAKTALDEYLKSAIEEQLEGQDEQRIYENGTSSAKFADFKLADDQKTATVQLSATGKIGPKIDDNNIKEQVKGKRTGEIQGDLKAIEGVSGVEVKLSPFWVSGVPDDIKKITIEFNLQNNG